MRHWEVLLSSAAIRNLEKLPRRIVPAVIEFIFGTLPRDPTRVGKPLVGNLSGLYSGRRGEYRVLYELYDDSKTILIYRIAHRRDAYRNN